MNKVFTQYRSIKNWQKTNSRSTYTIKSSHFDKLELDCIMEYNEYCLRDIHNDKKLYLLSCETSVSPFVSL